MNINVDATYRNGVLYLQTPLNLPENTPVRLVVATQSGVAATEREGNSNGEPPRSLKSPKFTSEQLLASLERNSFAVGCLPANFSRADIYSDHD